MELSIPKSELQEYVRRQANYMFPDNVDLTGKEVSIAFDEALERLEYCFQHITFPAYCDADGQTHFSHYHADQYTQFIAYFANSLWSRFQMKSECDKLLYLNRSLHSIFISYKCKIPKIYFLGHPVGTIMGNADYDDFLVVFQNVTINTAGDGEHLLPKLGKGLFLGAGAKIIGDKPIGNGVSIGVDALVHNQEIPDNKVVIRNADGCIEINDRKHSTCFAQNYFNVDIEKCY